MKHLLTIAVFAILAVLPAPAKPQGKGPPTFDVEVVNDDPVPVVIQNDSGMPTPVEIVSEGEPERTAWHSTVPIVVAAPLRTVNFTVPPGQRLVLETVSMAADVALGSDASFFFVLTFATGNTATQDIPIFLETQALGPFAALDRFVGIATGLSIAAEAGSQVSFTVETSPPSSIGEFTASFSGFLEPTP